MRKPVLIFRADASNKMGTGHLMRSASLAGVLAKDFTCKLLTACTIPQLVESVRHKFESVFVLPENAPETDFYLREADGYRLVVLDGYHFDKDYQSSLQALGFRLAVIDDLITAQHAADLLINHCGGLSPRNFTACPYTVFALGTGYLLLNPVFLVSVSERRQTVNNQNCFVCLGGADPENETLQVVQKLSATGAFSNIHVVAGAAYLHHDTLSAFCQDKDFLYQHQALPAHALKELMQQCSFAVCSPSTIALEYLSVGGVAWLKQIADNQKEILRFLTEEGLAFDFDKNTLCLEQSFSPLLAKQALFFDGKANERLERLFLSWYRSAQLCLHKATEQDLLISHNWANDPEVRNQSFSSQPIPLEVHSGWFRQKIADTNSFYYLVWQGEKPVAQIRFDIVGNDATISYLIGPELRGQGLGAWILAKGIRQLLEETSPQRIIGHVKQTNVASQRSFEKLAFERRESPAHPGSFTYTMRIHGN